MDEYVAFLRGINVSGQKLIKMELLRQILRDAGFNNVKTYIQSGNILFTAEGIQTPQLILKIEKLIEKSFGFHTDVILRTIPEIRDIVSTSLFSTLKSDTGNKYYITFLKDEYIEPLTLPVFSKNKDVEIIHHDGKNFTCVSTLYKGNYGFPNSFIEKLTKIPATTRNPNTLEKILKL